MPPLSFSEKREIQRTVVEQNKILSGSPSFAIKRQAQKVKVEALAQLGKVSKQQSSENQDQTEVSGKTNEEFGLTKGGKKTRERINAAVADIVSQIQAGKDPKSLTPDEINLFMQYSGKGGLTENSQYEYYTPTPIAEGVWDLLAANGFENGNVLEPSTGAGVFSATKKPGSVITGAEIDPIAATVNQVLHPEDHISNQSFEKLAVSAPDNHFDAVIGNVPFGNARGASANDDPEFKGEKQIERYFIDRVIDKTRPGGLITLIVPIGVVGDKSGIWKKWRAKISRKAEFLGAHKLPSKTFGKQGTDTVTDIIVLRKHPADLLAKVDSIESETLSAANVLWDEFISGQYWLGEGKKFIKGQFVPKTAGDRFSREQVIPEDGTTPETLKRQLAIKFESRIDWGMIDSAEPVINYYQSGDHRVINGKECVFDGAHWSEVKYTSGEGETPIDAEKYGAATLEALQSILESPESMLAINSQQAFSAYKKYPNLFNTQQRMAIEFSMSQPLDKFREQAYRGSLIGSLVTQYIARANIGKSTADDQAYIKRLLEDEVSNFGHPKSSKGFMLEGEMARYFGAFLGAINEKGVVSSNITEGIEQAAGYDDQNVLSIVEYLVKSQDSNELTMSDIIGLYNGPRTLSDFGSIADIDGIAIMPSGFISTTKAYCSGEVYLKIADIQAVMETEKDPRVKDKLQKQIDLMMSKVKYTTIDAIGFGLRDKWIDNRYKIEFLKNSGYEFQYLVSKEVMKESETGEEYLGFERVTDSNENGGEWKINASQRKRSVFNRQLEYYMNGKSIGFNVGDTQAISADNQKADLRNQIAALEEQFKYFMQSHPEFSDIERNYNVTFNHYVTPEYDDSDLGLTETSGAVKPHWYQNIGVRRLSEEGTGILGDDVGLGKTTSGLAFSAYDRQMGRSNKHCIVVPNSVLANWYNESKKFFGKHDNIMFIGFEPKRDIKTGDILTEVVLDEEGKPQVNQYTNEVEYQDILVKDEKDGPNGWFEKLHKIPFSNAAVVIMTEEKFAIIPMREESRLKYANSWAQKNMMSKADAAKMAGVKSYADAVSEDRLNGKFSDDGTAKKGELPYFEDMGFDRVIVDEGHRFRNSFQIQDGDTAKLAYLPNPAIAKRAVDLAMKASYLREKYDGKGTILLTATPVANSPIEIFNMLSLVIDQAEFERMGVYTPDDFVRQFGDIKMVDKLMVRGDIQSKEGLGGFKNLNSLRGLFHRYALMRGPKDVDPNGDQMKLPEAVEMIDQADMDSDQHSLYMELREEAKEAGKPHAKGSGIRSMFAIIRDMDRVTTDVDMYNKEVTFLFKAADESKIDALIADMPESIEVEYRQDDETGELVALTRKKGSKAKASSDNVVIKNINKPTDFSISGDTLTFVVPEAFEDMVRDRFTKFKIDYYSHPLRPKYAKLIANMQAELDSKGKQLVFTEEKSQHQKLLTIIINHLPVKASQVAIINADTAGGEKLQELSDAYNRGDIRIIIANKKAEVGVNLQKGTSAIHHMTLPWNPASLQQRNGRGVRQGNKLAQVRVYYYQARGSFDEYRLDLLKNKGNWIANLMDRNNDNDTAENSEAMGAIEQAALLSDNREEFLSKMAAQKAAKDAEEKQRKDQAARVKFNNLTVLELTLLNLDASKAKAQQDADNDVVNAQKRLDKDNVPGADKDLIEKRIRDVAIAKNRAAKVAATWEQKRALAESQKRQITAFLKGQGAKGELPFDVGIVENPLNTLMTKERLLVTVGNTYKKDTTIIKVTAVHFTDRTVEAEAVTGYYGGREGVSYDVDKLLRGYVEVNYTPDEIERMKWLNATHNYADLAAVTKDYFLENQGVIQYTGAVLYRQYSGKLNIASSYNAEKSQIIYPDKDDKALQAELIELYKASIIGTSGLYTSALSPVMTIMFGTDWEEGIRSTLKTASQEDIRAKASELVRVFVVGAGVNMGSMSDIDSVIGQLRYQDRLLQDLIAWMTDGEYVNIPDARSVMRDTIAAEMERLQEVIRQLRADAEKAKNEAIKSLPGYKEVPPDMDAKFSAIGLTVFYNTERVVTDRRASFEPFTQIFIKDRAGKNGVVYRLKEILKSRMGAKFCSGVSIGDRKYGDATWHVAASNGLDALYDLLS
jgi:SNF2 family DNA or RNA helicase